MHLGKIVHFQKELLRRICRKVLKENKGLKRKCFKTFRDIVKYLIFSEPGVFFCSQHLLMSVYFPFLEKKKITHLRHLDKFVHSKWRADTAFRKMVLSKVLILTKILRLMVDNDVGTNTTKGGENFWFFYSCVLSPHFLSTRDCVWLKQKHLMGYGYVSMPTKQTSSKQNRKLSV